MSEVRNQLVSAKACTPGSGDTNANDVQQETVTIMKVLDQTILTDTSYHHTLELSPTLKLHGWNCYLKSI